MSDVLAVLAKFLDLVRAWVAAGKDPAQELDALIASADTVADAAERAKFGDGA